MAKYIINKNENEIHIFGDDQCFNDKDIKDLWDKHKILYLKGGIMAVWIEERKNNNPLVHLMNEDDGHIFWKKRADICFDGYWLDNYINTLTELKRRMSQRKSRYRRLNGYIRI